MMMMMGYCTRAGHTVSAAHATATQLVRVRTVYHRTIASDDSQTIV